MLNWKSGPYLRRAVASQRGVTLYEALVAVALLGFGVAMVSQMDQIVPSRKLTLKRSCDGHAESVVVAVQEETYYREIINFFPTDPASAGRDVNLWAGVKFTDPTSRALPTAGLANQVWTTSTAPSPYVVSQISGTAANGVTLSNSQLIQGSVRTLSGIYNNNAGVRGAFGTYGPLTNVPPAANALPMAPELLARNPVVTIRLQPYNIDGSALGALPAQMHVGPQGEYMLNGLFNAFAPGSAVAVPLGTGGSANYEEWVNPASYGYIATVGGNMPGPMPGGATIATLPGGVSQNRGFELRVQIVYDDENGAPNESCNFTQKFEYPRDRAAPPPPNVNTILPASNLTFPVPACVVNQVSGAQVRIGYQQASDPFNREFERGTTFLCRDLSWLKWGGAYVPPAGPNFTERVCVIAGVPRPSIPYYGPAPGYNPLYQDFSLRFNQWAPCDRLRQCGVAPDSVTYSAGLRNLAPTNHLYTMTYNVLPQGCVMNYEVIAVDTAGNSSIAGQAGPGLNRRFLDNGAAGIPNENEIAFSDCTGAPVVPGPTYFGPYTFADGYFNCP